MTPSPASRPRTALGAPERAVIDIGSNTVRLVVYSGPRRAPSVWLNEKVTARLGRDLAATGRIPQEAFSLALRGLARFSCILQDIGVKHVETVATAAARDAENGLDFIAAVRSLGLVVRVLSGEEEAQTSAYGVIGAFPGARGTVADLGGGSLELVAIGDGECSQGISLPLGTLRLPALRAGGMAKFNKAVRKEIRAAEWSNTPNGPIYMVGGTWRALASFAMHKANYPLSDPQAFTLSAEQADKIAKKVMGMTPDALRAISGISSSRAAGLPHAAAMLRPLLAELQPDGLIFSSWGLREGLMFRELAPLAREQDPLLAAVAHFCEPRGGSASVAAQIAGWTTAARGKGAKGEERLRLAAMMLALAQLRIEPNFRLKHSTDWALDKRWLGLDHRGRALIASALRGAVNKPEPTEDLLQLASETDLVDAAGWGLAFRLCRRIGAGSRTSLLSSRLRREENSLVLWIEPERAQLISDQVESDLNNLALWLGCDAQIEI